MTSGPGSPAPERTDWGAAGRRPPGGLSAALRHTLLWASRQRRVQRLISTSPLSRRLVRRFVAGETLDDAAVAVRSLVGSGLTVTVDLLGEETLDQASAAAAVAANLALIRRLSAEGLAQTEVSLKLSALGLRLDEEMALWNAGELCQEAAALGIAITIDMEDHTTTDATLRIGRRLREGMPSLGLVIQASLHRSVDDCRALAHRGSRVRLCKGAYQEPPEIAWQGRHEVRTAYIRCLQVLLAGGALPLLATHDPALIAGCHRVMERNGAAAPRHEHQMLYGIRSDEQARLRAAGEEVRVYVPFGERWYPYLVRRLAEHPSTNVVLVLRSAL
jgi:proline dehydrogenase